MYVATFVLVAVMSASCAGGTKKSECKKDACPTECAEKKAGCTKECAKKTAQCPTDGVCDKECPSKGACDQAR